MITVRTIHGVYLPVFTGRIAATICELPEGSLRGGRWSAARAASFSAPAMVGSSSSAPVQFVPLVRRLFDVPDQVFALSIPA
jgi:hypothetical protein